MTSTPRAWIAISGASSAGNSQFPFETPSGSKQQNFSTKVLFQHEKTAKQQTVANQKKLEPLF